MNNLQSQFGREGIGGSPRGNTTHEEVSSLHAIHDVAEIETQLGHKSDEEFEGLLAGLIKGDLSNLEYLLDMKKDLASYATLLHVKFGTASTANKLLEARIRARQQRLDEVLKSVAH